ncbi:MAG TPA: ATP-binding protein, partial [Thermoanaerobaculia bacterium]|nr:ATP-binding protein [Thermoanaerobaculia bacterium]
RPEGIVYEPCLFATATVHYQDAKKGIDYAEEVALLGALTDEGADWYAAEAVDLGKDDLESEGEPGAFFGPLPAAAVKARSYSSWTKDLEECLYRTRRCELFRSPMAGLVSNPGESERDFRIRLADAAREKRDEQVDALRKKYGAKIAQLQDRIRRAEQTKQKQEEQARHQTLNTVITAGSAVLGMFFGRRRSMSSAGTAVRGVGRAFQERGDVSRAEETVEALRKQLADLNTELENEVDNLEERFDPEEEELEVVGLKPRKTDVEVRFLTLAWAPKREGEAAWR